MLRVVAPIGVNERKQRESSANAMRSKQVDDAMRARRRDAATPRKTIINARVGRRSRPVGARSWREAREVGERRALAGWLIAEIRARRRRSVGGWRAHCAACQFGSRCSQLRGRRHANMQTAGSQSASKEQNRQKRESTFSNFSRYFRLENSQLVN